MTAIFCSVVKRELAAQIHDPIEEKIELASLMIDEFMESQNIPGLVIAIGQGDELLWHRGFGFADLESQTPATPEHLFRIASISKSLTSVALGILVEGGLLDLDAEIQEYVPYFPAKPHQVTPRLVASHLAGIRHYRGSEFFSKQHFNSVEDAVMVFANDSLISIPGEEYHYSSFGWNLLSAAIEGASGRPFLEFMREFVFDEMEMTSTYPELDGVMDGPLVSFYRHEDGEPQLEPEVDNSIKWAGGGFVSTSADITRFGLGMMQNKVLTSETFDLFTKPMKDASGTSTRYGIGWASDHFDGRRYIGHTGGAVGGSSILFMLPDSELVVSIICNVRGVSLVNFAKDLSFMLSPSPIEVR